MPWGVSVEEFTGMRCKEMIKLDFEFMILFDEIHLKNQTFITNVWIIQPMDS